jgi:hypothetical protein
MLSTCKQLDLFEDDWSKLTISFWEPRHIGPDDAYVDTEIRMSAKDAIRIAYAQANSAKTGFVYESEKEALDDFMVIHWADVVHGSR